ncbi:MULTISPECIES: AAA family ATPase [Shewanella]|uniref:AAA family ATPase n=1 Tax=Shewanella TaxID=22 RepID=UPI000CAA2EDF|nr:MULTISPECIES: AAA family ATPase [Shewanella]NCO71591.1 ATP-binding protein [Shewanella vesiculosa]NCP73458.1 ATP-binding protein [Shewanella vesiculosa]NCP92489.1 ATP-binding protein [Shewanella vesiculosa]NCP99436.1 ATP-binding protein [Shewanella vesiculosa]NCQ44451.1 ATP-binding protein [Shewanella frigidimarina]
MKGLNVYVGDVAPAKMDRLEESFFLKNYTWDDYSYQTTYKLFYINTKKVLFEIGSVKIATSDLKHYERPFANGYIKDISDKYFSLGQDKSYYSFLRDLPNKGGKRLLAMLNDIALNREVWVKNKTSDALRDSLQRNVTNLDIISYQMVFEGKKEILDYCLTINKENPVSFKVNHNLPFKNSNIHAVIGNNGVGKTTYLKEITKKIVDGDFYCNILSKVNTDDLDDGIEIDYIERVLFISFSAFDNNIPDIESRYRFEYLGLHDNKGGFKSPDTLSKEFSESLKNLVNGKQLDYIKVVLKPLENVDYLGEHVDYFFEHIEELPKIVKMYTELSSGHRIVLHTLVLLMDSLHQGVVTLFDEPETHLHPPLLGAFLQSLQIICDTYNGLLIFATHSPIILQEILTENVLVLRRLDKDVTYTRPDIVTYGQNVSKLTRTVFGYQNVGFHNTISELVDNKTITKENISTYNQIGSEATTIAWSLLYGSDDV